MHQRNRIPDLGLGVPVDVQSVQHVRHGGEPGAVHAVRGLAAPAVARPEVEPGVLDQVRAGLRLIQAPPPPDRTHHLTANPTLRSSKELGLDPPGILGVGGPDLQVRPARQGDDRRIGLGCGSGKHIRKGSDHLMRHGRTPRLGLPLRDDPEVRLLDQGLVAVLHPNLVKPFFVLVLQDLRNHAVERLVVPLPVVQGRRHGGDHDGPQIGELRALGVAAAARGPCRHRKAQKEHRSTGENPFHTVHSKPPP